MTVKGGKFEHWDRLYLDRSVVSCSITMPTAPVRIHTHRVGLEQVLTNLLTNAAEALADGGGNVAIATTIPALGGVIISVTDDGPGISPEANGIHLPPAKCPNGARRSRGLERPGLRFCADLTRFRQCCS